MWTRRGTLVVLGAVATVLAACGNDGDATGADTISNGNDLGSVGGSDASSGLKFYLTCGDPVCGQPNKPPSGLPACATETAGAACSVEGALCDPKGTCGEKLVCAKSDPKANGTCPVSRARWKTDIRYVDDAQRQTLAHELLQTRLATYHYTWDSGREHLGFLIDDQPLGAKAVDPERNMVDLYGYLSLSVATIQQQQREIDVLKAKVAELEQARRSPAAD